MFRSLLLLLVVVLILTTAVGSRIFTRRAVQGLTRTTTKKEAIFVNNGTTGSSQAYLFEPSYEIRVLSPPSVFPKPTDKILLTAAELNDVDGNNNDGIDYDNNNNNNNNENGQRIDNGPATARTNFPQNLTAHNIRIIAEPVLGRHRPNEDAIFAYAEGYKLPYYMMFMETLRDVGYAGDVVLCIAETRILADHVLDYLRQFISTSTTDEEEINDNTTDEKKKPNLILYQPDLYCPDEVKNPSGRRVLTRQGDTDVFQLCQLNNVYGWIDPSASAASALQEGSSAPTPLPDPRDPRVVATIRYEWYWIWSQRYRPTSWIMLLDARDSYFQSNPFVGLPRRRKDTGGGDGGGGVLYFFGENADATRLGLSKKNVKWLRNGYGQDVLDALRNKPTICSGSTMGERVALESYLRAMVNEHDERHVIMTGSDQGFHNYLYYSGKLRNAVGIDRIVVWEQGKGAINNLGALRIRPLAEWGVYDANNTHGVFQWGNGGGGGNDKSRTLSPVVHQWDRDHDLHRWMHGKKHAAWRRQWFSSHSSSQQRRVAKKRAKAKTQ